MAARRKPTPHSGAANPAHGIGRRRGIFRLTLRSRFHSTQKTAASNCRSAKFRQSKIGKPHDLPLGPTAARTSNAYRFQPRFHFGAVCFYFWRNASGLPLVRRPPNHFPHPPDKMVLAIVLADAGRCISYQHCPYAMRYFFHGRVPRPWGNYRHRSFRQTTFRLWTGAFHFGTRENFPAYCKSFSFTDPAHHSSPAYGCA